jgi:hypothetical protein
MDHPGTPLTSRTRSGGRAVLQSDEEEDPDEEPESLDDFDEESPDFEPDFDPESDPPDFESLDPLSPELESDFLSLDFESEPERSFDSDEEEECVAPLRLSVL